jgi:hypothetical protein
MHLRWSGNPVATCYSAAEGLMHGCTLADAELQAALAEPAAALKLLCESDGIDPFDFMQRLVPLSVRLPGKLELARAVLVRFVERERADERAALFRNRLIAVENPFELQLPRLREQRPLHPEHLPEAWQQHKATLLPAVIQWTEPPVLAEEADVVLMHQVMGGRGDAHPEYNVVRIESAATDPVPALPELLRLLWLLCLVNLDLPRYEEVFQWRKRAFAVGALAFVPVAVAAGADARLVACDRPTIELAARTWLPPTWFGEKQSANLLDWWETYRASRPNWPTALAALDRLLG